MEEKQESKIFWQLRKYVWSRFKQVTMILYPLLIIKEFHIYNFNTLFARNFAYFWEDERKEANDPCSINYHGERAFSEPESRAIRVNSFGNYCEFFLNSTNNQDFLMKSKGKIAIFNTVHAAGRI